MVPCVNEVRSSSVADGLENVLDRCADRLYALALRITGVRDDAVVALEDALRVVAAGTSAHGDASAFEASLYRNVARAAHHRLRQRRGDIAPIAKDDVVPRLDDDGHHFAPMDDWSGRTGAHTLDTAALSAAIDALPPDNRTALILHDVEAVATGDIGEILGIDVPAVKLHVHRARLFVRSRLAASFALDHGV